MALQLNERDQAMLSGEYGQATQMAMRILTTMAGVYGASKFLDIESAHIDGCLYHGYSGLEFARRLLEGDARVCVPTTLNVGAVDLLHPEYFQGSPEVGRHAEEMMRAYQQMGCLPIFTCAPYQTTQRPSFGAQIAWAESNAIVFANSVLGARTNRYGDFIDICAAITGRAPAVGLHLPENRRGQIVYKLEGIPERLLGEDILFPVLGYLIGARSGTRIPVIEGLLTTTTEDQLKALGAAAASSGAVALFHAIGVTPEAPTIEDALQHKEAEETITVTLADLRNTLAHLGTVPDGPIDVVALGSPHFSLEEFAQLMPLLEKHPPHPDMEFIVCTNRLVLTRLQQKSWLELLRDSGVQIVVDTCVVVTPIVHARKGILMTNSGKFAHYSPGNIGLQVVFGGLVECVRSAELGTVWRDESLWEKVTLQANVLVPGNAEGEALVLPEALSLWGGLDPKTGNIIDQRHPTFGENVKGKVLVLPIGRGSSSASSILLEAVRCETAPAAIITAETDAILALGAAVAREMYAKSPPVLVLDEPAYSRLTTGAWITLSENGDLTINT